MKNELTSERLATWESLIVTVGALLRTFDEDMEKNIGIPLTWYDVLIQLNSASEGKLRMQALAEKVVLSRGGLTRLVDRMEKAGLVDREHSKEDRRGYYAVLTERGRQLYAGARPVHHKGIQEYFASHLSDADIKSLAEIVKKVRKGMGI